MFIVIVVHFLVRVARVLIVVHLPDRYESTAAKVKIKMPEPFKVTPPITAAAIILNSAPLPARGNAAFNLAVETTPAIPAAHPHKA